MNKTKKTGSRKKGLGRGLESLLKVSETPKEPAKINLKSPKKEEDPLKKIHSVAIENLVANKEQPRRVFKKQALDDLAQSISEQGIMQPIVAIQHGQDEYEIIAGERRWRAAQQAGLKEVPIIIKEVSDQNKLELAIIENIQRDDLNPVEEGEAYQLLAQKYKLTQKDIAQKVGKDRATVANLIRITSLSPKVKEKVSENKLSLGHAKVLLAVENAKLQAQLAEKVERLNLSVRATESLVKNALNPEEKSAKASRNSEYRAVEEDIKRAFGTKVKIVEKNGKGRVELNFHNLAQFNEIVEKLTS